MRVSTLLVLLSAGVFFVLGFIVLVSYPGGPEGFLPGVLLAGTTILFIIFKANKEPYRNLKLLVCVLLIVLGVFLQFDSQPNPRPNSCADFGGSCMQSCDQGFARNVLGDRSCSEGTICCVRSSGE